jgi:hypothetical protein
MMRMKPEKVRKPYAENKFCDPNFLADGKDDCIRISDLYTARRCRCCGNMMLSQPGDVCRECEADLKDMAIGRIFSSERTEELTTYKASLAIPAVKVRKRRS